MTAAVGLRLAQRRGLRRGNIAGSNAVALDIDFAKLGVNGLGGHLQTTLSGSIAGDGLVAKLAHHRADVDDFAMALGDHTGQAGLGHDERCVEVDVDNAAKVLGAHVEHRGALDDAGVVDQGLGRACHGRDVVDVTRFLVVCWLAKKRLLSAGGLLAGL